MVIASVCLFISIVASLSFFTSASLLYWDWETILSIECWALILASTAASYAFSFSEVDCFFQVFKACFSCSLALAIAFSWANCNLLYSSSETTCLFLYLLSIFAWALSRLIRSSWIFLLALLILFSKSFIVVLYFSISLIILLNWVNSESGINSIFLPSIVPISDCNLLVKVTIFSIVLETDLISPELKESLKEKVSNLSTSFCNFEKVLLNPFPNLFVFKPFKADWTWLIAALALEALPTKSILIRIFWLLAINFPPK